VIKIKTENCLNCGKETTGEVYQDNLGEFMSCSHCISSFDVDVEISKAEFVKKCGELLHIAKPHLLRCEYFLGKDIKLTEAEKSFGYVYPDEDECVVVTCQNGYRYILLVTGNSLNSIAAEIFSTMAYK
jgi:hypothetical protein